MEMVAGRPVLDAEIDIMFHNKTSDNNIVALIFARCYPIPLTEETFRMAWKIMMVPSMGNVKFSYPKQNKIAVFFFNGSSRVSAGPYDAEPGSTWIATAAENGSLRLDRNENSFPVPDNGYVIHNRQPDNNWTGRVLHIALYKGSNTKRPLVSKQCRVGNYVTLTDTNTLYFGAMIPSFSLAYQYFTSGKRGISMQAVEFSDHDDLTLIPDAEFTSLTPIDLTEAGNEPLTLEVNLTEEPYNGKLVFKKEWRDERSDYAK